MKSYFVYIACSQKNGTLYIGITDDLIRRIYEHKNKLIDGFTKKYDVDKLIYYEEFTDVDFAIESEKKLKKLSRERKLKIITDNNSDWEDLYFKIIE